MLKRNAEAKDSILAAYFQNLTEASANKLF